MNLCHHNKSFLAGIFLFLISISVEGQESDHISYSDDTIVYDIHWIAQFPAEKKDKKQKKKAVSDILLGEDTGPPKERNNQNWFTDLLFGKNPSDLVKPMSLLAVCPDTFYIADQGTGSILQVYNGKGETLRLKNKSNTGLPSIVGSCFGSDNTILFTDSKLNDIYQVSPGSRDLKILNGSIVLDQPTGIAYSIENKQIWVAETGAHRISILNESCELIRQIGGRGNGPGEFNYPTYLWIDKKGIVYVVDAMNFRVQIFDSKGDYISSFGSIGDASGYMSRPKGIATDSYGHIYIADALFHAVQVFDLQGKLLYTFGTQGEGREQFWMPTGIYIDEQNFIYIADSYNSRVQIFQLRTNKN